ncbi:MAG: hypothetical protein NTW66_04190 [Candidatus Magasanikbacteria bacterium]|nr:hypothetical protein [Candidatus Magasanikbacteria bacterium]
MKRETPIFKYENQKDKEISGEVLPPAKDLSRIWHDLLLENETDKEAEMFEKHVQLFKLGTGETTEHYLILTDVQPEKEEELKRIFGTKNEPISVDLFLARVSHAKAAKHLPISFNSYQSKIYKIA